MRVRARSLAFGGECVSDCIDQQGAKVVFVPGLIPGEEGTVEIVSEQKNFSRAALLSIEKPSEARVNPPCPYYSNCGGCNLQHMQISKQRELKLQMIESMLRKQAGLQPKAGIALIGADLPAFGYRKRLALHLSEHGDLGFHRRATREVVDIDRCLLANEQINQALTALRTKRERLGTHAHKLIIDQDGDRVVVRVLLREGTSPGKSLLEREMRDLPFSTQFVGFEGAVDTDGESASDDFPAGHFSQVNPVANQLLVDQVVSSISEDQITELYAGSGNFTLPLASRGRSVTMVEIDPELTRLAQLQAEQSGLSSKIKIVSQSAERFMRNNVVEGALLLDPPRSGAKIPLENLKPEKVNEIVYVSCNLPSLCRDLKIVKELGYELLSIKALDMFPQTHHVETISVLHKVVS